MLGVFRSADYLDSHCICFVVSVAQALLFIKVWQYKLEIDAHIRT